MGRKRKEEWRVSLMKTPGSWVARIKAPPGFRPQETRKTTDVPCRPDTRPRAEAVARAMLEDIRRAFAPLAPVDDPSLEQVFRRYLLAHTQLPNTRRNYLWTLKWLPKVTNDTLTAARLYLARDDMQRHLKPGGINDMFARMGKVWRWALARDLVKTPWPKLEPLPLVETEKRPYDEDEVEAILSYFERERPEWAPFFTLLAETGLRFHEAADLKGADLGAASVFVRKTKTKAPREIPANPATLARVRCEANAWVFPAKRNRTKHLPHSTALGVFKRALRVLGIAEADMHSFRRYVITELHERGVPLDHAMRLTGHRNVKIHLGYMRRSGRGLEGSAAKLWRVGQETVQDNRESKAQVLTGQAARTCGARLLKETQAQKRQRLAEVRRARNWGRKLRARLRAAPAETAALAALRGTFDSRH